MHPMVQLHKILISEIMTKNPYTIGINEPFSRVWELLRKYKIRHLPVIGTDLKLAGIISQRDLYRTVAPKRSIEEEGLFYSKEDLDKYFIKHSMNKDVTALKSTDPMGLAMDLMVQKKYGCIPIIDEQGYLVGLITQIDIIRATSKFFV